MYRILLHLLLWTAYVAVEFVANLPHYRDKQELLLQTVFFLPVIAVPYYFIAYFLVPRLLWQGKKLWFWLACIIVFLLVMIFRLQWENWYWHLQLGQEFRMPLSKISKNLFRDYAVIALGVCLKIIRDWDKKDRLATRLTEEKRDAELQFLRAQIHPHFLFNTLNNLFVLARKKSDKTADAIMMLSKIMRFVLYECRAPRIAVGDEARVIQDYIELEKLRYNKRLSVEYHEEVDNPDTPIAPLLLLPFVENSFKHGASGTTGDVEIRIQLTLRERELCFLVRNTVDNDIEIPAVVHLNGSGIGLKNVQRQLDLLYPGQYDLHTGKENGFFTAELKIRLTEG